MGNNENTFYVNLYSNDYSLTSNEKIFNIDFTTHSGSPIKEDIFYYICNGISRNNVAIYNFPLPPIWWLSGGISAANCLGAFRATSAGSKSNSLVNLNDPGTNPLVEVGTAISQDDVNGWTGFDSSNYLKANFTLNLTKADYDSYSLLIKYQTEHRTVVWSRTEGVYGVLGLYVVDNAQQMDWWFGEQGSPNGGDESYNTDHIYVKAGRKTFYDGVYLSSNPIPADPETAFDITFTIGNVQFNTYNPKQVALFALYNTKLTDEQALALSESVELF